MIAPEERRILEDIASDMGAASPDRMTDQELVSYICDR